MKYLFVCTGNTCRSPMAEAFAQDIANRKGLKVEVESAGLTAYTGESASEYAQHVLAAEGLSLLEHRSRRFIADMATDALVLAMTKHHAEQVHQLAPQARVETLYAWAGETGEVYDPFGGSIEEYQNCAKEMKRLIEIGLTRNNP